MTARALMQAVPDAYRLATRGAHAEALGPIEPERARVQHASVVEGMRWLGFEPMVLGPAGAGPDAIFVEDPVVVVGTRALMTRSAHPGRADEGVRLQGPLAAWGLELVHQPVGALDGGDVLIVGGTAFAGRSGRTNDAGIRALADAFPSLHVRAVDLPDGVLHLKCEATPLGDGRVLATARLAAALGVPHVEVPDEESYAANAVARSGRVLIAEGYPRTAAALVAAGFDVRAIDTTEIHKGDGSLTCLSVRVDA